MRALTPLRSKIRRRNGVVVNDSGRLVASSAFDATLCYRSISHSPHAGEHDPSACGGQLLIVSHRINEDPMNIPTASTVALIILLIVGCGSRDPELLNSQHKIYPTIKFASPATKEDVFSGIDRPLLPNPMGEGNITVANPSARYNTETGSCIIDISIKSRLFSIMNLHLINEYCNSTVVRVIDKKDGRGIPSKATWTVSRAHENWPFYVDIAVCTIEINKFVAGEYKIEFEFPYNERNEKELSGILLMAGKSNKGFGFLFYPNYVIEKWGANDYSAGLNTIVVINSKPNDKFHLVGDRYQLSEIDGRVFPTINGDPLKFLLYRPSPNDGQNLSILTLSPDGKYVSRVPFIHNFEFVGIDVAE